MFVVVELGGRQSRASVWLSANNLTHQPTLTMSTFNPTPSEIALTSQIFAVADPQNVGIVTGDTAVKILAGANLSHAVLGEIWAIADKDNNGFLTKKGVAIALRLIGFAQKGESITEAMLDKREQLAMPISCLVLLMPIALLET